MELNKKQIEFIQDNHTELLDEVLDEGIDNELIYTDDVWNTLKEHYSPFDLLNGQVAFEDLYEAIRDDLYHDEDTYIDVYDRLNDEQQEEINELADEE